MPVISTPQVIAYNFDAGAAQPYETRCKKAQFNSQGFNLLYVLLRERFNLMQ